MSLNGSWRNSNGRRWRGTNGYGKYYSFRRLRNIMQKYFRAKISMAGKVKFYQNTVQLTYGGGNLEGTQLPSIGLYDVLIQSTSWPSYSYIFGKMKWRGVLFVATPCPTLGEYSEEDQRKVKYQGTVRVGVVNDNTVHTFNDLTDANMSTTLGYSQVSRRYFPFNNAAWRSIAVPHDPLTAQDIPYRLAVAQSSDGGQNVLYPVWTYELTFYVTFAQSII